MANDSSSTANNLSSFSGSYSSTASTAEQQGMQSDRLASSSATTASSTASFTDRLVTGSTLGYDHEAAMADRIATFSTQYNGTTNNN